MCLRAPRVGTVEVGADLDFLVNMTTLLYKSELQLFGGQYATWVLVPLMDVEIESTLGLGTINLEAKDSASGLGDIALIPIALYWNEGKYHWSFAHFIVTPTGSYDVDNGVNTSLNYWSFDSNFALTYLNEESGRDLSFNVGHIYNTESNETDYQTGQELHFDIVLNQFLSDSFAIGLQGFYLKQITGDDGRGATLGDFKAEAAGIGPALLWSRDFGKRKPLRSQPLSDVSRPIPALRHDEYLPGSFYSVRTGYHHSIPEPVHHAYANHHCHHLGCPGNFRNHAGDGEDAVA